MRTFLTCCLLAAAAGAQTIVDVPTVPTSQNTDLPFAAGVGRYQQWYSPSAPAFGAITEPMRIQSLQFFAGSGNAGAPSPLSVDIEVLMGHGKFSFFGTFDNNWAEAPVTVAPLGTVAINNVGAGQVCMTVPFATRFTWDRVRPILLEIRVYGNNQANQSFQYQFGHSVLSNSIRRNYAVGNTGATSGIVQQTSGLITRFNLRPGVMLPFGAGCPGEGNIVPQISADQIAWPGITWTHTLSQAASQRLALWVIGDTNDGIFPVDLGPLLGLGPSPCNLLTNPVNTIAVTTVGGGAGSGIATVPIQLPGTTGYIGASLFTQFVVFDPLSISSGVAVTPGLWTIVAPIGG